MERYGSSPQGELDGITQYITVCVTRPHGINGEDLVYGEDQNDLPEGKDGELVLRALVPMLHAGRAVRAGQCFITTGSVGYLCLRRNMAERVPLEVANAEAEAQERAEEDERDGVRRRRRLVRHLNQIRRAYRRLHGPGRTSERLPAWIEGPSAPAPQQDGGAPDPGGVRPQDEFQGQLASQRGDWLLTPGEMAAHLYCNAWTHFVSVHKVGDLYPPEHELFPLVPPEMREAGVWWGYCMLDKTPYPKGRPVRAYPLTCRGYHDWFMAVVPCDQGTLYCFQRYGASWPIDMPRENAAACTGFFENGEPVPVWNPVESLCRN
jgi:hypothetical protein